MHSLKYIGNNILSSYDDIYKFSIKTPATLNYNYDILYVLLTFK